MYRRPLLAAILLLSAVGATGRVISYAPYTSDIAIPAFQSRLNRHFALVETASVNYGYVPNASVQGAHLVIYDSAGMEEPRVVFPTNDSTTVTIYVAAALEDESSLALLVQSDFDGGMNPARKPSWFLSLDGGTTWKKTALPDDGWAATTSTSTNADADIGGPFIRAAGTGARSATHDTPFIISGLHGIYSVARDGSAKHLLEASNVLIIGDNATHDHFLVVYKNSILSELDLDGNVSDLGPDSDVTRNGWIAGDGSAYAENGYSTYDHWLRRYADGIATTIVPPSDTGLRTFVAVPAADYNSVWMAEGMTGNSTQLDLYTPQTGIVPQWSDISGPAVEALLPGASGKTIVIQVHRVRTTTTFLDPALAVWHVGDPAPARYDELYLDEQNTAGFVHVDPDAIENGTPFVFDSGATSLGCPICSPPPPVVAPPVAGGSDVIQEWGVVHASLAQKLVLPGISHTQGAFGSSWLSDVTFYNPLDTAQHVSVVYTPTGSGLQTTGLNQRDLTLAPHEIRLVPDALSALFGIESGGGAFLITPDLGGAINVTSRTYTQAAQGTYGFGMNGIDVYAAVGARFGLTFSGAFFGANTRTNITVTDVSGRGATASLQAASSNGFVTSQPIDSATAPAGGQQQVNGIASRVGMQPTDTGGLVVQPLSGELIASVFAIDNRTNDPTYFPPDIPSTVARVIPALGHVDGANNSKFRSDLYLINPDSSPASVTLQINPWDGSPLALLTLTLLPNEARQIRDVLMTAFSRTGIARLSYQSAGFQGTAANVHVTSRTYTLNDDGGTYGALMPPLNSFQSAPAGDTLEILGASTDSSVRTNVGLVDLASGDFNQGAPPQATIAVYDKTGAKIDELTVAIPSAAGTQLNDLFRARNIASSFGPVLIRVTSVNGLIGAYASVVDNGTNDSTYLPANLAAK